MSLKVIFVPLWLDQALKASNMSLLDATDHEKLAHIVSTDDLELYRFINGTLSTILPEEVVATFDTCPKIVPSASLSVRLASASPEEVKRFYLYGNIGAAFSQKLQPDFAVQHSGYDYVIITVKPEEEFSPSNLMNSLLKILNGTMPLSDLAKTPLFKKWTASRALRMTRDSI